MMIKQGAVYWLQLSDNADTLAPIAHPYVVIQQDADTVVVCALTTNMRKISIPGNLLLTVGEANLAKQSIVEVGKVLILDKAHLGDYIGTLSEQRVTQILAGQQFLQRAFFRDDFIDF